MEGKFSLSFFVHLYSALVDDFCLEQCILKPWRQRVACMGNIFGLCYKTGRTEELCLCQDYGRMLEFGLRQSNPDIVC